MVKLALLFCGIFLVGIVCGGLSNLPQERQYGHEFVSNLLPPVPVEDITPQKNLTTCSWRLGAWEGAYPYRENYPAFSSDSEVIFYIEDDRNFKEESSFGTIFGGFGFSEDGFVLHARDLHSDPPNFACGKKVAEYHVTWSEDCESFTLNIKEDFCARRISLWNELTLTIRRVSQLCQFNNNDVWRGVYPDNNMLVGRLVNVHIEPGSRVVEESSAGRIYSLWAPTGITSQVKIRDEVGYCHGDNAVCPNSEGLYRIEWADDCRSLQLHMEKDSCNARTERYDKLHLSKVGDHKCSFEEGTKWTGRYEGDTEKAGKKGRWTIGAGMRVTETNPWGTIEQFWFINDKGDLRTRDAQARPVRLGCPTDILSLYTLVWADDCSSVMLSQFNDECMARASGLDGIVLTHETYQLQEPPTVVNFNFEGLIPSSKCCQKGYSVLP